MEIQNETVDLMVRSDEYGVQSVSRQVRSETPISTSSLRVREEVKGENKKPRLFCKEECPETGSYVH